MKGNPRFCFSQKSGATNLRESIELSQAVKRITKCDLCGEVKETDPVQFSDELVRLCEKCRKECEQK